MPYVGLSITCLLMTWMHGDTRVPVHCLYVSLADTILTLGDAHQCRRMQFIVFVYFLLIGLCRTVNCYCVHNIHITAFRLWIQICKNDFIWLPHELAPMSNEQVGHPYGEKRVAVLEAVSPRNTFCNVEWGRGRGGGWTHFTRGICLSERYRDNQRL